MQVHDINLLLYLVDYGDKDNMDLAERFSISTKKDDYPAYLLFLQGQDEPIRYKGDAKNADDIKKFLMKESGLNSLIALKFSHSSLRLLSASIQNPKFTSSITIE